MPTGSKSQLRAGHAEGFVEDIAIVGLSGRYPLAENLDEFWENLKAGRDCITEIPPERWDHSRYYDDDKNQVGKSNSTRYERRKKFLMMLAVK